VNPTKKSAKKPSRKQLLDALGECQNLFGEIKNTAYEDRPSRPGEDMQGNNDRAGKIRRLCDQGFELTLRMRSFDPPTDV
jgi:hypothetical protein